jgi:hypothetical protein
MLLAGLAGSGKNESISSLLKNPDGEVKQNGDTLPSFNSMAFRVCIRDLPPHRHLLFILFNF